MSKSKMPIKDQRILARKVGKMHANEFFRIMSDPVNRGKSFKWKVFPSMCRTIAREKCRRSFSFPIDNEIRDIAANSAFNMATKLIGK